MDGPSTWAKPLFSIRLRLAICIAPESGLFACAAEPRCGTIGDEADNRSFVPFTRRCDRRRHLSGSNTYLYAGRNRPQEHLPLGAVNVSVGSKCEILPCRSKKQRSMRSANAPRRRQDRCDILLRWSVYPPQILSDRSGSSLWRLSPSLTRWWWRFSLLPAFAPGARVHLWCLTVADGTLLINQSRSA
jgi:hypothetical protein